MSDDESADASEIASESSEESAGGREVGRSGREDDVEIGAEVRVAGVLDRRMLLERLIESNNVLIEVDAMLWDDGGAEAADWDDANSVEVASCDEGASDGGVAELVSSTCDDDAGEPDERYEVGDGVGGVGSG